MNSESTRCPLATAEESRIEDVVQRRRNSSDLYWCLRQFHPTVFKYHNSQTGKQIKEYVYNSPRVQYTISQLAEENGEKRSVVETQAKEILEEMGHNFQMSAVRGWGFVLSKLMRQLFTNIYVNRDGIEKIRTTVNEHPVIYMPTHRSYVDFLLLSYVCFTYGLPVPVIAAGLDFMSMKGMQKFLRNAGAFFIRRSFGHDKLYWNIFSEYVQIHVRNGDPPLEFFIEGTRSRTAKSLVPKLGFLSSILETFFKSEVTDIAIVPISISYDRTLEEGLYAYELLGVPKPKESTKGLFKARQILKENFGMINLNAGEPILLSDFCKLKMCKRISHPGPKYLFCLTSEEQNLCKMLAYKVVREHQINSVLSPFTLIASLVLTNLQMGRSVVPLNEFVEQLKWLKSLFLAFGGQVHWRDSRGIENLVTDCVEIHKSVLEIKTDATSATSILQLVQSTNSASTIPKAATNMKGHTLSANTLLQAVPGMLLSHYSNQLLHVFVRPALIAIILTRYHDGCEKTVLFKKYHFLETLLSLDFIFEPGETDQAFSSTLLSLQSLNFISCLSDNITKQSSSDKYFVYLNQLLDPFLITYKVVCHAIAHLDQTSSLCSALVVKESQCCIEQLLLTKRIVNYVSLSLDMINNAVHSLLSMKVIEKTSSGKLGMCPNFHGFASELDELTWLPVSYITDQLVCSGVSSKL